jgi:hypothetical protein
MNGFLAFIARQYNRKAEDVGSDVVAHLLHESHIQNAFCGLLAGLGFPNLKPSFAVETRSSGENGIPDIKLLDDNGECRVIIENKFWALLTSKQPSAYINEIAADGLVLFVVPRLRRRSVWEQIQTRCVSSHVPVTDSKVTALGCSGRVGVKHIAVISWTDLLAAFSSLTRTASNATSSSETEVFLNQLRRLCDVEDSKKVERLDERWISNTDIALAVYDYMKLVNLIVESAADANYFLPERRQGQDSCGEGYFGKWGQLGSYRAWIGFDARLWSERGESSIWIEFADKEEIDRELRTIFFAARGRWNWLEDAMRVGTEITQYMFRSAEGLLGVDDPVVTVEHAEPGCEGARLCQRQQATVELKLATMERVAQSSDKLAAEHTAEHADGQEEGSPGRDPA